MADWRRIAGLRTGFRNRPDAARQGLLRAGCRHPNAASRHLLRTGAAALPACRNLALFRSRLDSSQARQTVRWSRFRGLKFAPVFAVNQAMAARQTGDEQMAKAARRIGSASPGCEPVSAAARAPQGKVCASRLSPSKRCKPAFAANGGGGFARVPKSGAFSLPN